MNNLFRHLAFTFILALTLATIALAGAMDDVSAQDATATPAPASISADGPIVGDQSLFPAEVDCMQKLVMDPKNHMVNHLPAIGSPEHTDSAHSGVFPCATFTGNITGTNQVFQYQSTANYDNIQFISFAGPYEAYLYGGSLSMPSTFVARFDPSSGEQIWRTYLTNRKIDEVWQVAGGFSLLQDGSVAATQGPDIWRLDPSTGVVLAYQRQPVIGHPERDANWDGIAIAPDERGTILLKSQTRPGGCNENFQQAMMIACEGTPPNTTVVAVDPVTLENLAAIELDQMVIARPIVTEYKGKIYMYLGGLTTLIRVIWDPETNTLTQDSTWAPEYLLDGQGPAPAPGLMGKWIIASANANPSNDVPICVVAVSQDDATDLQRICPWGETLPVNGSPTSFTEASPGTDPENNMIYVQDWYVGGVYAIQLDPDSGAMEVVWNRPDIRTVDFFTLVGPADQRVMISQYIGPDFDMQTALPDFEYSEGVIWLNPATGETLALSSVDNPSTAPGVLVNVGYGGRVYTMGNEGSIFIYQVMPVQSGAE